MTTCPAAAPPWPGPAQGRAFGQFQYPTVPLHVLPESERKAAELMDFALGEEAA
jgi:hypothetical protein